jgi:hypothetical protein
LTVEPELLNPALAAVFSLADAGTEMDDGLEGQRQNTRRPTLNMDDGHKDGDYARTRPHIDHSRGCSCPLWRYRLTPATLPSCRILPVLASCTTLTKQGSINRESINESVDGVGRILLMQSSLNKHGRNFARPTWKLSEIRYHWNGSHTSYSGAGLASRVIPHFGLTSVTLAQLVREKGLASLF